MNDESSKTRILDCALALFSSRGYDGVGISEICTAAKISKPTLYYYFSSKEGLYNELWKENFAPLRQALITTAVYHPQPENYYQDILPVLVNIITVYTDFATEHPSFFRMLASLMFAPDGSAATKLVRHYRDFQRTVFQTLFTEMAQAHGNLTGKEQLLAVSFLAMIFSYVSLKDSASFGAEALARQFMHGIFS